MDANNTRYHLLLGQRDWDACQTEHLQWDEDDGSIHLESKLFLFKASPKDVPPKPEDRRGAARDQFGNWYWIGPDERSIRFLPMGAVESQHYWEAADLVSADVPPAGDFGPVTPAGQPPALTLRGLAVTEHHYLVVGVVAPEPGLLVFDLHAGGPPVRMLWPVAGFEPFDMAPAPGGGVWILDRANRRYWALDGRLRVIARDQAEVETAPAFTPEFEPVDGTDMSRPARTFPTGISLELASPIEEEDPLAIEALPDGTVLILDGAGVHRYRFGEKLGSAELLLPGRLLEDADGDRLLRGHDLAVRDGLLYVAATDGNQTFVFRMGEGLTLELQQLYLPMRRFGGKGIVAAAGEVWYDYREQWLPLTPQQRPRYEDEGLLVTGLFDGKEPDCVWHRLFLDGCIPAGAAVRVESRAGDDPEALSLAPWFAEPDPYLRGGGSELPYLPEPTDEGAGTWELLLQQARGRFLQLRLTLTGTGRNTPRLRALRVYYPRFSYLKEYLPAVYREDEQSASFLERFLANVEGLFTSLEDRIAQAQLLFDVRTAPPEYLDWLSGWFGVILDPSWDENRRRLFIAHAPDLFAQRGTVAGLIRAIRLAIDPCPDESLFDEDLSLETPGRYSVRVMERFLTRRVEAHVTGGLQWAPEQGPTPLHVAYRDFLKGEYGAIGALNKAWGSAYTGYGGIKFPPVLPACEPEAGLWRNFLRTGLGFRYTAVDRADQRLWQEFLARRYRRVEELNRAWGLAPGQYASFAKVELPQEMPTGKALEDWVQFVSTYLPAVRAAHRFTVLVPTAAVYGRTEGRAPSLDLVRRIVALEKPAHTEFEVREYWALFRVGEARLGLDTLLDTGSRLTPAVLGQGVLAGSYLSAPHPWNVPDRLVAGRDRAGERLRV